MLGDTARPQDILLAYDADFGGFSSLEGNLDSGPGTPVRGGGNSTADGYYEDFSARLDRFVRENPRLGAKGAAPPSPPFGQLPLTDTWHGNIHCRRPTAIPSAKPGFGTESRSAASSTYVCTEKTRASKRPCYT